MIDRGFGGQERKKKKKERKKKKKHFLSGKARLSMPHFEAFSQAPTLAKCLARYSGIKKGATETWVEQKVPVPTSRESTFRLFFSPPIRMHPKPLDSVPFGRIIPTKLLCLSHDAEKVVSWRTYFLPGERFGSTLSRETFCVTAFRFIEL